MIVEVNGEKLTVRDLKKLAQELTELDEAVDGFERRMRDKLLLKVRQGCFDWRDPKNLKLAKDGLNACVKKLLDGDVEQDVDVANLAMMIGIMLRETNQSEPSLIIR
jgi:hypothetical protein